MLCDGTCEIRCNSYVTVAAVQLPEDTDWVLGLVVIVGRMVDCRVSMIRHTQSRGSSVYIHNT